MSYALIIDCETTGNEPLEVIELGAVDPASGEVIVNQRYRPERPITYGAMATHHILPDELAHCPPSAEVSLPACDFIVGHNIDYDWAALGKPDVKRICTLALCRMLWPNVDCHKLGAMMYCLDGDAARDMIKRAHSAVDDCQMTRVLLGYIRDELECESWSDLWQISEQARVPTHFTFGKHKGLAIKDAPSDYKAWLLRQPDVDEYLAKALRA